MQVTIWVYGLKDRDSWEWNVDIPILPRVGDELEFDSEDRDGTYAKVTDVVWHLPNEDGEEIWISVHAQELAEDAEADVTRSTAPGPAAP